MSDPFARSISAIDHDLHEQVERRQHRIDYAGASLLLISAGMLIFGLLQGGTAWAWGSPPSIAVFAIAVVAALLVVVVERRAAEPIMPPWLWGRRLTGGSFVATIAAGLLVIGLSTFLPTWAQSVLGLDAVAAGFVLATMSITWPLASAVSNRLYLRIGFRDTAVLGGVLAVAAGIVFTTTTQHSGVWQPVLGSALMGAGLGLITTSLIVGLQSTVDWSRRGVVTGGVIFSRFLGQSIGAAIFGAITNSVLAHRLASAPTNIRGQVPRDVDGISRALKGAHLPSSVQDYLRTAIHASTHAVFVGLLVAGIVTVVALIALVPRSFPTMGETDPDKEPKPAISGR
jgi:MFS family permease